MLQRCLLKVSAELQKSLMAEKYSFSRRQAQTITAAGYDLLVEDLEKINIKRTYMTAKLIVNLELDEIMH